jgi:DHA2 family multidrug resistance protein-like MFS transporter
MSAPRVITAGIWVAAAGFAILAAAGASHSVVWIVAGFTVYALGLAPVFTLATDLIVGCAPPEHAGAASAISETGSELGGALGIALLGSVGTAVYRTALSDVAIPGIPPEVLEAARSTLGAAVEVAQRVGGSAGASLADAARAAFVDGMRISALAAALLMGVMAWLTAKPLQSVSRPAETRATSVQQG